MTARILSGYNINKEVEHVALAKGGCYIASLQGPPLIVFSMDPGSHRQLCDEYIAAFREENWGFC